MRRLLNLYKQDDSKLEYGINDFYTYNEYFDLVPVVDIETESGIIISNTANLRERKYVIDALTETANEILTKRQTTTTFSLARFNNSAQGVLVGQGPSTPPIWKTFDSIFPSNIYEVGEGEAVHIEGSTFLPTVFSNSDILSFIFNNTFINKKNNYQLEIKDIFNDYNYYTNMKTTIEYTPFKAEIIQLNGVPAQNGDLGKKDFTNSFTITSIYEYDVSVTYSFFMHNRLNDTLRKFDCVVNQIPTTSTTVFQYKFFIPSDFQAVDGDDYLYMGNVVVRSSLTNSGDYIVNYKLNDIESITPIYKYDSEIKGEQNTISSTVPVNIDIINIDIAEHHGYYIDAKDQLHSFGIEYKGEISSAPSGSFRDIACGKYHNVAIDTNFQLVSWGSDEFGQVSDVPSGNFKKVYAFDNVSAAISETDELFVWGDTIHYDLTIDTIMTDVMDIAIGERFMLILKTDGKLIGIGDDTYGQISSIPIDRFKKVEAGRTHCSAISEDLKFYAWGCNNNSQLSNINTIYERVIDIVCTDYGGGAITENNIFKPYGKITGTSTQTYNRVVAGNENIILLKNGVMNIELVHKNIEVSGDKFNLRLDVDVPDVVITKIYTDLDILV